MLTKMILPKSKLSVSALGSATLSLVLLPPLIAQDFQDDLLSRDIQRAFENQIERLSRMLPDDSASREQFNKGLEEMRKAFEEDAANPSADGRPRTFEFRWEGDSADDLAPGDLRMEFQRRGGFLGGDFFDRFFGPGSDRFDSRHRSRLLQDFDLSQLFDFDELDIPELSKNHPDELAKFRPVVEDARLSTIEVLKGGKPVALGTIVSKNGYALTKLSELGSSAHSLEAGLSDGRIVAARMIEELLDQDLALLKLDAAELTPATFVETELALGTFLAAPSIERDPAAVGVLSVQARNLSPKSKGFLGIMLGRSNGAPTVHSVTPDSAAAAAGIQPNDVITEIDGFEMRSSKHLIDFISGREPDEIVEISYLRNGRSGKTSARLKSREELARLGYDLNRGAFDPTRHMGANLNRQRGGYPSAIQHDLPLRSSQMGGPLVDLDGNIVGINIARAGRVSTYALPADEVNRILATLDLNQRSDDSPVRLPGEQAPLPGIDSALREEVDRAEAAIREARKALRAAEQEAREAREALDRQQRRP